MMNNIKIMGECEICGKHSSNLNYIKLEGTVFHVCSNCSSLGEEVSEEKANSIIKKPVINKRSEENQVIVSDYGKRISVGRQKAGLRQEELANKLNERLSMLKSVESGKLTPTLKLARKLESVLNIKLIEFGEEE